MLDNNVLLAVPSAPLLPISDMFCVICADGVDFAFFIKVEFVFKNACSCAEFIDPLVPVEVLMLAAETLDVPDMEED